MNGDQVPKRTPRKIRFAPAEWERITTRAMECGKPPARYVRDVVLGAIPRARRSAANAPVIRELGRIGNALVELTQVCRARDGGSHDLALNDRVQRTLDELLFVVRKLR